MIENTDNIRKTILEIIKNADRPLETKDVGEQVMKILKDVTRTKLFYRLTNLRGDGLVNGRRIGPGKGVWIWWRKGVFERNK